VGRVRQPGAHPRAGAGAGGACLRPGWRRWRR
jgi:hypothetical protein